MGRSTTSSCLKIITCGSDTGGQDELELQDNIPESKGSSDKRRWSFRKRTASHRVLSNSVATESPSSGNNDGSDPTAAEFQAPVESVVTEKISLEHWDNEKPRSTSFVSKVTETNENPQLSTSCNSKLTETNEKSQLLASFNLKVSETKDDTTNGDCKVESKLQEADATVIQAAIRGFLGRQELQKIRNVVKLQAAVRGHLVRRHAVGTLRCAQAIVKMQALVRARRACILLDQSCLEEDLDGEPTEKRRSKSLEKNRPKTVVTYTSISKLLGNRFARQLLDSTPRTKTINIKCDLSKPDSTWRWLERWMSASAPDPAQSPLPESDEKQKEKDNVETSAFKMESENPPEVLEESVNQQYGHTEKLVSSESEENLITYDANNFNFEAYQRTSSKADNLVSLQPENATILNTKEVSLDMETVPSQTMQSDANSVVELNDISNKPETENEKPKPSGKRSASEQLETEVKKFVPSSRKASNPAFIAAHSKFEELSSTANSARSFSSSSHSAVVESNTDAVSLPIEYLIRTKELGLSNNLVPHDTSVHVGGSECGTELSVTSTLDSPDRFELGGEEVEHEAKNSNGGAYISLKTIDVEDKDVSHIPTPSLSDCVSIQLERCDDVDVESRNLAATEDVSQVNQEPEKCVPDGQLKLEPETGRQTCKSSPTASPKSLVTVPESQGTPSSQISVKAKRGKSYRSESDKKRKSLSAGKRSPANPIIDNGARSSMEQLPKDQRSGKRRNSFGSVKPDQVDQEQRNSSSSLPNYMQATESARAKAHANSSPRSSPDVQEREIYIKKRHSLPGANGRQESPRVQRSMSQTQQNTKGNGVHHERKWQR